ncbi:Tir chaperone family protein, partial [Escherichia coli]|nr:Tir chaperone family protein [Escherichia coli]EGZ3367632.1 Tir chaperone family protein [Escherichia coli]
EILFFYCYLSNNEPDQINKILKINNNREMLGMFFLSSKDDKIFLNIAFPTNKIDITEFTNLMENGYLVKKEIIKSLSL